MAEGIERGYLRLRLAAALSLMLGATFASHLVDQAQSAQVQRRMEIADAFDVALTAVTEQLVSLGAVRDAASERIAGDERTALSRSVPVLEGAAKDIREALRQDAVSPQARALLESNALDPIGLMEDLALVSRTITERPELWGKAAAVHVGIASSSTLALMPVIRRVKALEAEALDRSVARLDRLRWAGLALVLALVLAIWALIFAPMERRVSRAHEAARRGREAAEAASEAKSAFIATVSHEIRTPLGGVLGMADLLADTPLDREQEGMVATIASTGRMLLAIVNDVLDLSKVEAGRLALDPVPFDARGLLHETGRLFEPQARAKGIALRVVVEEAPAPRHLGDELRLRQVLSNLAGNAVKFTEKGAVTLRLAAGPVEGGRQALRLEVEDSGIGMTPAELDRVFEAFEQAEAGTARRHGGTGLGLAIARRLVEAMGGRLTASSAPGRGSTFRVDLALPVLAGEPATAEPSAPAEPSAGPEAGRSGPGGVPGVERAAPAASGDVGGGPRVLVVDDNAVNRTIASGMLRRAGARVELACDGAGAVEAARGGAPELIFMDISMPGMDGLDATRAIRATERREGRPRTPVVALSAHVGEAHRARCLAAGMDDVLGKPIARAEIEGALARHAAPPEDGPARARARADDADGEPGSPARPATPLRARPGAAAHATPP